MLFFLNSPLPLLLIQSTLWSARHALALFCQKLNLHGKQLLGQGAEGPWRGWACLPQPGCWPFWPRRVEKPLGLTLSCCVIRDKALPFSGLVLSWIKGGFEQVSLQGSRSEALGFPWEKQFFPSRCMPCHLLMSLRHQPAPRPRPDLSPSGEAKIF